MRLLLRARSEIRQFGKRHVRTQRRRTASIVAHAIDKSESSHVPQSAEIKRLRIQFDTTQRASILDPIDEYRGLRGTAGNHLRLTQRRSLSQRRARLSRHRLRDRAHAANTWPHTPCLPLTSPNT